MIYFIGDRPSKKNTDKNLAFVGTKSYTRLLSWIDRMNLSINNIQMYNKSDILNLNICENDKIIALGKEASKYLNKRKINHLAIDHPSGLNRNLNDKNYVDKMLKKCKNYIDGNFR